GKREAGDGRRETENPREASLHEMSFPSVRLCLPASRLPLPASRSSCGVICSFYSCSPRTYTESRENSVDSEIDRPAPAIDGVAAQGDLSPVPGWVGIVRGAAGAGGGAA